MGKNYKMNLKDNLNGYEEKLPMKNYEMDLSDFEELQPIESPDSILGPWFFVHKV